MINLSRRSVLKSSALTAATSSVPNWTAAQATSYTADDLKGILNPFGGLRAGNADGTIPAWTGGYSTVPAGYQPGDPRPIPFADEKPLFVITGANYTQHQDKLSPGAIELLKKYPTYNVQVFPTHRTSIAPQYVYDYISKNATNAQISPDGNAITGAYGGIPFPIPKNGHEVMWNHELAWAGKTARAFGHCIGRGCARNQGKGLVPISILLRRPRVSIPRILFKPIYPANCAALRGRRRHSTICDGKPVHPTG